MLGSHLKDTSVRVGALSSAGRSRVSDRGTPVRPPMIVATTRGGAACLHAAGGGQAGGGVEEAARPQRHPAQPEAAGMSEAACSDPRRSA